MRSPRPPAALAMAVARGVGGVALDGLPQEALGVEAGALVAHGDGHGGGVLAVLDLHVLGRVALVAVLDRIGHGLADGGDERRAGRFGEARGLGERGGHLDAALQVGPAARQEQADFAGGDRLGGADGLAFGGGDEVLNRHRLHEFDVGAHAQFRGPQQTASAREERDHGDPVRRGVHLQRLEGLAGAGQRHVEDHQAGQLLGHRLGELGDGFDGPRRPAGGGEA